MTDDRPTALPVAAVVRPRYREDQWLRTDDLQAEQAYRLRLRRLHELGEHHWGIVEGLGVMDETAGFTVHPGTAVDGYGRALILAEPVDVPGSVFDRLGTDHLDAWLLHGREPATPPQRGTWACGPGQNSRWVEQARLRLTGAGPQPVDPRQPPGVPATEQRFPPHRPPPDDPARRWPVYLGRLRRVPGAAGARPAYHADTTTRPYAGLVGACVSAPSGRASMQVGGERPGDTRRFAVTLAPAPAPAATQAGAPPAPQPGVPAPGGPPGVPAPGAPAGVPAATDRLVVDAGGRSRLAGTVSVAGAVRVQAPSAQQSGAPAGGGAGAARRLTLRTATPPAAPAPWTLAHVEPPTPAGSPKQLRVELAAPGDDGDPSLYRLQIGRPDENGRFAPCLTVDAGCAVTVHGELVVGGQLIEGPIQADPTDPRFAAAAVGQWAGGLTTAGRQVDSLYAAALELDLEPGQAPHPGETFSYTLVVTNPGRATATDIAVYATVAIDGSGIERRKVTDKLALNAGHEASHQLTYNVPATAPADQTITVSASAIGIGPVSNYLSAAAQAAVDILPPLN